MEQKLEQTLSTERGEKVTIALFLSVLFEFGRSAADDLGGSHKISL
jgi:hypothetical protein